MGSFHCHTLYTLPYVLSEITYQYLRLLDIIEIFDVDTLTTRYIDDIGIQTHHYM